MTDLAKVEAWTHLIAIEQRGKQKVVAEIDERIDRYTKQIIEELKEGNTDD